MKIPQYFKKFSLALLIFATLSGIAYLANINHENFKNAILNQAKQQLKLIAKSEAQSIESYIHNIQKELEILALQGSIQDAAAERRKKDFETRESLAYSFKDIESLVDFLYLADSDGNILEVVPPDREDFQGDISYTADIKHVLHNQWPHASPVFKVPNHGKYISLAQPVFKGVQFVGVLRVLINMEKVNRLIAHINRQNEVNALVIDKNAVILSCPDVDCIGEDVRLLAHKKLTKFNLSELICAVDVINKEKNQDNIANLILPLDRPTATTALSTFTPVKVNDDVWIISIVMDNRPILSLINKNLIGNCILVGSVFLLFIIAGIILFRIDEERAELNISEEALRIINKQLHLELNERKQVEQELHDAIRAKMHPHEKKIAKDKTQDLK